MPLGTVEIGAEREEVMSTGTVTVGYPVHALKTYRYWKNRHGVWMTDWTAHCGASGGAGGKYTFGVAGNARRLELCPQCFPGRKHNGVNYPDPIDLSAGME